MREVTNLVTNNHTALKDVDMILISRRTQLIIKRIFDLLVSFIGLIILSPFLLIIALLIKIDSTGPVFFKQKRVGKDGKIFNIFKFRTMINDAERKGLQITVGKDIRITRLGHFLRKTKVDELPQLINVIIGDMSFVGPRPEVPKYVNMYNEYQKNILKVKPGITDIASIEYINESEILSNSENPEKTYVDTIMVDKIGLNMKYITNISLINDIKLIMRTIYKIAR